jgi:hypothetical protein
MHSRFIQPETVAVVTNQTSLLQGLAMGARQVVLDFMAEYESSRRHWVRPR